MISPISNHERRQFNSPQRNKTAQDRLSATARYEMMKADWIRANQFATSEQYQDAMREIARKCGVY